MFIGEGVGIRLIGLMPLDFVPTPDSRFRGKLTKDWLKSIAYLRPQTPAQCGSRLWIRLNQGWKRARTKDGRVANSRKVQLQALAL